MQSNHVTILRATHLGMCFGVRDAIQLALRQAQSQPLTILGELVHNDSVNRDLRAHGIAVVHDPAMARTSAVMISAHGASERRMAEVRARGLEVFEATCPLVRHAHQAVQGLARDGFHPVIIGERNHVEVRGLTEDLANFDVVLTEEEVKGLAERSRFGVAVQTTQRIDTVRRLVGVLRETFPRSEVRFADTVCQPTKLRQSAAVDMAQRCDVVIVVGGAASNNTRQLAATCARFCPRTHHIQDAPDLRDDWLFGAHTVGLTAGTSTPDAIIDAVEEWLKEWAQRGSGQCGDALSSSVFVKTSPPGAGSIQVNIP